MYTIKDYLKYYKNYSLEEYKWNEMDNLLCAILAYSPVKNFKKLTLEEFTERNLNYEYKSKDLMVPKVKAILKQINKTKRYQNMMFYNFINRLDSKTQFGAMTIRLNNIKVISFKGSDGSLIGWHENFRLIYQFPTYTQKLSIDYLKDNINLLDRNVFVVGHSKGGNLAMASAMMLSDFWFNKVKRVYNFDGPGFRKQEFNSLRYDRLAKKLINIVPTGSYIGVLLYNKPYKVITTSSYLVNEHYPTSWNCFGEFLNVGKLSIASKKLHDNTTRGLENLDIEKIEKAFEDSFKILNKKNVSHLDFTFPKLMGLMKTLNTKSTRYIYKILLTMFKLSKNR